MRWWKATGRPPAHAADEEGRGKNLRALRHRLPHGGFRLTYCHNATLGRRDFYRQLCLALGLKPSATAAAGWSSDIFYRSSDDRGTSFEYGDPLPPWSAGPLSGPPSVPGFRAAHA